MYGLTSQDNPAEYDSYQEGTPHQIAPKVDVFGNPIDKVWDGYYYQAQLTNLKPGTVYYFRVGGNSGFTREWKFRTIAHDENVKFVFGGDSRRPYTPNFVEVKKHLPATTSPRPLPPRTRTSSSSMAISSGREATKASGRIGWTHGRSTRLPTTAE